MPADGPTRSDLSTLSLRQPSYHDRQLLASKFLSRPRPGDAVDNKEATDRANDVRPPTARNVTAKAVEDCMTRWSQRLRELGVTGIDGRENVNQLGRQLLAYGFLRQEDREL